MINRGFKATPDYTVPSLFKVGTGTTTPVVSDTDLVTPVTIDSGDTKAFVSGYPTIDETNLEVTIRTYLNSLEANGNNLTEFGVFNTDASELMVSRAVFTSITKNNTVEISFIEKEKFS